MMASYDGVDMMASGRHYMMAMLCNPCYAIYAMQSMLCNLCYAINAMQSRLCRLDCAIWIWQSGICNPGSVPRFRQLGGGRRGGGRGAGPRPGRRPGHGQPSAVFIMDSLVFLKVAVKPAPPAVSARIPLEFPSENLGFGASDGILAGVSFTFPS